LVWTVLNKTAARLFVMHCVSNAAASSSIIARRPDRLPMP